MYIRTQYGELGRPFDGLNFFGQLGHIALGALPQYPLRYPLERLVERH